MSTLNRTTFDTTYVDASGTFATNGTRQIGADDLRQFSDDISDSLANLTDDLLRAAVTGAQQTDTASTKAPSCYINGTFRTPLAAISSASVLTGFSSPVTLISAPGSGLIIVPVQFFVFLDYNSSAYAVNANIEFIINGVVVGTISGILSSTSDRYATVIADDIYTTTNISNSALQFRVASGNPTTGNSPLYISCIYRVMELNIP